MAPDGCEAAWLSRVALPGARSSHAAEAPAIAAARVGRAAPPQRVPEAQAAESPLGVLLTQARLTGMTPDYTRDTLLIYMGLFLGQY